MSGTLKVITKHNPFAWVLNFIKVNVTVDGYTNSGPWGEQYVTVAAGTHVVDINYRYLGMACAKASATLNVAEGQTVTLDYRAPVFVFMAGKIVVH